MGILIKHVTKLHKKEADYCQEQNVVRYTKRNYIGTRPLSRCYHDIMKTNLTLESLLNQLNQKATFWVVEHILTTS